MQLSISDHRLRNAAIAAAIPMIAVIIIDILATRQMIPYNDFSGYLIFMLNIVIAYGIGSYVILAYVARASSDTRSKSKFLNSIFWTVASIQTILLGILIVMAVQFYYQNVSVRYLTYTVFAASTIAATAIMMLSGYKFFSWYRSSKSKMVLVCGLATISIASAMVFDASAKLLLVKAVEEESPSNSISREEFVYRNDANYLGEVQYKVVKPDSTTLYIVPSDIRLLYHYVNGWIPITFSFIFTWIITVILLQHYHSRMGRLPIIYWALLAIPLVLYMVGRTTDLYVVFTGQIWHWEDFENPMLLKSIFRAGTIGGSIMFGIAFFAISRKVMPGKVKNYLTIAAVGAAMMIMTLSPSAQQQTFGVAGRSLMLLASFLLCFGFYLSAVSIAYDTKLCESIRSLSGSSVLNTIGLAQRELQLKKSVLDIVKREGDVIEEKTGVQPPLEDDMKQYVERVLKEVHRDGASAA